MSKSPHPLLSQKTPEQLLEMLLKVRMYAIGSMDDRTVADFQQTIRQILVTTREVGNDFTSVK